jgi:hypothetical protein
VKDILAVNVSESRMVYSNYQHHRSQTFSDNTMFNLRHHNTERNTNKFVFTIPLESFAHEVYGNECLMSFVCMQKIRKVIITTQNEKMLPISEVKKLGIHFNTFYNEYFSYAYDRKVNMVHECISTIQRLDDALRVTQTLNTSRDLKIPTDVVKLIGAYDDEVWKDYQKSLPRKSDEIRYLRRLRELQLVDPTISKVPSLSTLSSSSSSSSSNSSSSSATSTKRKVDDEDEDEDEYDSVSLQQPLSRNPNNMHIEGREEDDDVLTEEDLKRMAKKSEKEKKKILKNKSQKK